MVKMRDVTERNHKKEPNSGVEESVNEMKIAVEIVSIGLD